MFRFDPLADIDIMTYPFLFSREADAVTKLCAWVNAAPEIPLYAFEIKLL
jgi:hypothetical protein